MTLFSGVPGGEDAAKLIPKYLADLSDIPTLWVTEACAEVSSTWTNQFRPPQAGDVREAARRLMRERDRETEGAEQREEFARRETISRHTVKGLIAGMREAAGAFDKLTPEQQEARREEWLQRDIKRGAISEKSAANLRAMRGTG